MSLDDAVNAERARARAASTEQQRAAQVAARERDAGRVWLLELVAEAHRILRDRGGRRAVQARFAVKQTFFSGKDRFTSTLGETVYMLGTRSGYVITEDGRLVEGSPLSSPRAPGVSGGSHRFEQ